MQQHKVSTQHIQEMATELLELCQLVNLYDAGAKLHTPYHGNKVDIPIEHILGRAKNLAEHCAAEIEDERMRCLGWRD